MVRRNSYTPNDGISDIIECCWLGDLGHFVLYDLTLVGCYEPSLFPGENWEWESS